MYEYKAKVIKIHDGDTVTVNIDQGFDIHNEKMTLRLYGINCPELSTEAGPKALNYAKRWLGKLPAEIIVRTIRDNQEKYGRYLALVIDPKTGKSLNKALLNAGHAAVFMVDAKYWETQI